MGLSLLVGSCVSSIAGSPIDAKSSTKTINTEAPVSNLNLSYAFTQANDHPEKVLVGVIGEARTTLDIAIYSLTHPDIIQVIADAKKRGVVVRIISDKTEAKNKTQAVALTSLTIVDNKLFTSGSFNYSKAAATTNDEVLIVDRDPIAAVKWDHEFVTMWNDSKKFANY
jgi:phosphatidylserine/phosphatidylglycerophosphate/cardiolipin synthase-like enzyme